MKNHPVAAIMAVIAAGFIGLPGLAGLSRMAMGAEPLSFQEDVLPIFVGRCVSCHSAPNGEGYQASGLDLTTYNGLMAGTKYGPMVIVGDPENSNLIRLLDWRASAQLRMPHGRKQLSWCDRLVIRQWIRQGARDN